MCTTVLVQLSFLVDGEDVYVDNRYIPGQFSEKFNTNDNSNPLDLEIRYSIFLGL